jgi:hypothetical protein
MDDGVVDELHGRPSMPRSQPELDVLGPVRKGLVESAQPLPGGPLQPEIVPMGIGEDPVERR